MTAAIIILIWIAGWISAYPRHKKWAIEDSCKEYLSSGIFDAPLDPWLRRHTICAGLFTLFFWYGVWIYIFSAFMQDKYDSSRLKKWLNNPAKF